MAPGKVQDFKRHSNDQNRSVGGPKAAIEKDMKCFFCNNQGYLVTNQKVMC